MTTKEKSNTNKQVKSEEKRAPTIARIIDDFISEINSLRLSTKEASAVFNALFKDRTDSLLKYIEKAKRRVTKIDDEVKIQLKVDMVQDFIKQIN